MSGDFKCKGCTERYVGCHSKCESYINIKAKRDNEREKLNKQRELEEVYYRYRRDVDRRLTAAGIHGY